MHHRPTETGLIAVFDGSGGSGAAIAHESAAGMPRTGAWVGSRVARAAFETWFGETAAGRGLDRDATALTNRLARSLSLMRPTRAPRLVGRVRRELPTTMAALRYRRRGGTLECRALWAGDSRAYLLTPEAGLQALTRDHTDEADALEQLLQDPPMTNVICADRPFRLDQADSEIPLPSVLVCATDGFFGYVDTPAHFECHLLRELRDARDAADWADLLSARVTGYTADDASLSLVAIGYRDFEHLRDAFSRRTNDVLRAHWPDGPRLTEPQFRSWRSRSWHEYRPGYERLMPALPGARPDGGRR
ncbi:serine/threonine protein phosphatase [Actinomadura sp. KC06]|nr:serine/threonine protein phosphatase [Actinomadura sp. KC06]